MKHIEKGAEPESFAGWKRQSNQEWTPSWAKFQNPEKREVKDALLREQGGLCAYCCQRVRRDTSHVEHVAPRNARPDLALDYANFVASCPGEPEDEDDGGVDEGRPPNQIHCGHAKRAWHKPDRFIDPRDPDSELAFTFTAQGEVRPAPDAPRPEASAATIKKLNLSAPTLRRQRAAAVRVEIDRLAAILAARGALRKRDVEPRLAAYQDRGADGTFVPFQPALLDVLRQRAATLP